MWITGVPATGALRSVEAYAADGRRVELQTVGGERLSYDLSRWPAGAYMLVVRSLDGARHVLSLLKQ